MSPVKRLHCVLLLVTLFHCYSFCPSDLCSCNNDDEMFCSDRNLDYIPKFLPRTTDKIYSLIDLTDNAIDSLPPLAFKSLQTKSIALSRNPLIGVSPRAFNGLESVLESLDLYDSQLFVLHWGVLRNLYNLRTLNIGRNGMFALPIGLFDGLASLQDLSLSWNKLTSIKATIFRNINTLKSLNLAGNLIHDIEDESFKSLQHLHTLNLNTNQLRYINSLALSGLYSLENLQLQGNLLTEIPSSAFLYLNNMKYLNMMNNNISYISSRAFSSLNLIHKIQLGQNNILNISSDAFYGLTHLTRLELNDNRLESFGEKCILHGLVNSVRELDLRNNPVDCTCRIAWIHDLNVLGAKLLGNCRSPVAFSGISLSNINFTLCEAYECV